jgi:outer membrane protein OmpA-like peptidoglycan-associated protein
MDVNYSPFEIFTTTGALFLCLIFVCVFSEAKDIEQHLGAETAAAVANQDLYWVSVEPRGQEIVISGAAPDHVAKAEAEQAAAAIWGVSEVTNQISIIGTGDNCQAELDEYLEQGKITFKSGRADISESSFSLLGMLSSIARNCEVALEIAAHTDAKGDAAINLQLSQRRADAVAKYLAGSGVDATQLVAKGYGETQPIAPNTTNDGRTLNRRVEFRVLGSAE